MWRLDDPWALVLLILIPIFIYLRLRMNKGNAILFSDVNALDEVKKTDRSLRKQILIFLKSLALLLLILALSRPQFVESNVEVLSEGIDIILCLDTSGSMQAMDFEVDGERVNRLEVVKEVVGKFIDSRENDRMGMVVFAGNAYTQCPLTLDYDILKTFLEKTEIGIAGDGTAIGSALATSVKRLRDSKAKSKVIILLTDGRNNAGQVNPETAAKIAKQYGIKVYTIGAGTKGEAPFLVEGYFGKRYVYQHVDLDEETLGNIAKTTDGEYFRAMDTRGLESIYEKIDKMEKSRVKVKEYKKYTEFFHFFLLSGMFFFGIFILLENTALRKIP